MKIYDYNGKKNICGDRLREARVVRRLRQEDLAAQTWLNFEAERAGVNFSAVLQAALKSELHITSR